MLERNLSTDDILDVLLWGYVTKANKPKHSDEWKIRVVGKDLDNKSLVVVTTLEKNSKTLAITLF